MLATFEGVFFLCVFVTVFVVVFLSLPAFVSVSACNVCVRVSVSVRVCVCVWFCEYARLRVRALACFSASVRAPTFARAISRTRTFPLSVSPTG